jgi:hypothetical protein
MRTTEAFLVQPADFRALLRFKKPAKLKPTREAVWAATAASSKIRQNRSSDGGKN